MAIQANPYPLRIDPSLMAKFKIIAKDSGRSVNKEIEMLVRQAISAYEQQHGPIHIPDLCEDT